MPSTFIGARDIRVKAWALSFSYSKFWEQKYDSQIILRDVQSASWEMVYNWLQRAENSQPMKDKGMHIEIVGRAALIGTNRDMKSYYGSTKVKADTSASK